MKEAKRAISLFTVVCMLVCMVPVITPFGNVSAAAPGVMFGTTQLSEEYYINDGNGGIAAEGADSDNFNLHYISSEGKLVFNGLHITAGSIYVTFTETEIEIIGENSIEAAGFGIVAAGGGLSITGQEGASLSVCLSEKNGVYNGGSNNCAAIMAMTDIEIGGDITVYAEAAGDNSDTSGSETISYGISTYTGNITIKENAHVTAKGMSVSSGDSDAKSYGVFSARGITVTGTAILEAYSADAFTAGDSKFVISEAISANYGDFVVGENATVIAESGNATATGTVSSSNIPVSAGVYAPNGNVNIDGTLTATSGAVSGNTGSQWVGESYGVYTHDGSIDISGSANVKSGDSKYVTEAIRGNTISISGDANVKTGNAVSESITTDIGICATSNSGGLTISGDVTVDCGYAESPHNSRVRGIHSGNDIVILDNANVSVNVGRAAEENRGICASGDIKVQGGTVSVTTASVTAEAIKASGKFVANGNNPHITAKNIVARTSIELENAMCGWTGTYSSEPDNYSMFNAPVMIVTNGTISIDMNVNCADFSIFYNSTSLSVSGTGIDIAASGTCANAAIVNSPVVNLENTRIAIPMSGLTAATDFTGIYAPTLSVGSDIMFELNLGNAGGKLTGIKTQSDIAFNDSPIYITLGNATGSAIGISCGDISAIGSNKEIYIGSSKADAIGIKSGALTTNDCYVATWIGSAAKAIGVDATSIDIRGEDGCLDVKFTDSDENYGDIIGISTGAIYVDDGYLSVVADVTTATNDTICISCASISLTSTATLSVFTGNANNGICVNCTSFTSDSSNSQIVLNAATYSAIGLKAGTVNVAGGEFSTAACRSFGSVTGVDAGIISFANCDVRSDMEYVYAEGDSIGIRNTGNLTFDTDTTLDMKLGRATGSSVGIKAAAPVTINGGARIMPGNYLEDTTNCHVAALEAGGSFSLAEGLHWTTSAAVASTNGAYTWSADDKVLIVSTSAIVPYSGGGSHHSGGGGGSSASGAGTTETVAPDGSKTVVRESADGSKTTVQTDATGKVTAVTVAPSEKAVANAVAKGEPVKFDTSVKAAASSAEAVPVKVEMPASVTPQNPVAVEIPVENMTAGKVAVVVYGDGSEEIVKNSVQGEDGIVVMLEGSETIKVIDNTKTFSDVTGNEWFAGNVAWAAAREIMKGIGGGIFDAGALTNRGMISQILFNLEGARATAAQTIIATERFGDVSSNNWFAGSVGWLIANDIAQGQGSDFGAADPVTREQLAVMYYNYANFKGFKMNARGDVAKFADSADVSSWAEEALSWAVGMGLIQGTLLDDGSIALDPQGSSTRAMVAAITQRFCAKLFKV